MKRFKLSAAAASIAARITVFSGFLLSIQAANAQLTQIPLPDAAYTSSTTLIPIIGADGDTTLTLSDANLTVTFSTLMQEFTVPTSWSNWGSPPTVETSTPRVLSPVDFLTTTSVSLFFSQPLTVFGLEAEPDAFEGTFPVRLDFFNGVTPLGTVSNNLTGFGAALFAASSTTPITSVTLTIDGNAQDPAGTDPGIAQIRYALPVPEPSTWIMVATGLALLTVHRFRYTRK
jgi:hypothetical protein